MFPTEGICTTTTVDINIYSFVYIPCRYFSQREQQQQTEQQYKPTKRAFTAPAFPTSKYEPTSFAAHHALWDVEHAPET